jgi:DNA-directed RNA polymerase subunit M/transcription elongation factor TFIIS
MSCAEWHNESLAVNGARAPATAPPPPVPVAHPKSLYQCQCGAHDVVTRTLQTRSADEPMTEYNWCRACDHRWKT